MYLNCISITSLFSDPDFKLISISPLLSLKLILSTLLPLVSLVRPPRPRRAGFWWCRQLMRQPARPDCCRKDRQGRGAGSRACRWPTCRTSAVSGTFAASVPALPVSTHAHKLFHKANVHHMFWSCFLVTAAVPQHTNLIPSTIQPCTDLNKNWCNLLAMSHM